MLQVLEKYPTMNMVRGTMSTKVVCMHVLFFINSITIASNMHGSGEG
jgi:hypothetical protein